MVITYYIFRNTENSRSRTLEPPRPRKSGSPPLYLYLRADVPPAGASYDELCTFITEGWIAAGHWSAKIIMDNEFSWFDNTPGMSVYGGTEVGVLWGADGAKSKYEWKWKRHWNRVTGVDELINGVDHVVRIK